MLRVAPYKEGQVVFTRKGRTAFAICLTQEARETLPRRLIFAGLRPAPQSTMQLLGVKEPLTWQADANGRTTVEVPASVVKSPPCRHAFSFKFTLSDDPR